ncbi:MAG TPA: T9SS type A sorting domain-containing protein, partial [Ignavibacteriaceae bacterium]|nr:T9SS type A sorting domain-containing protein [Ignavibacteriaceae bacterium]
FILSGSLYKTTDSGTNWERIENAPGGQKLIFINDNIGFIGGVRLYKTTDGGSNWNTVNVTGLTDSTFITYNDIFFINQTTGWAVTTRGGIVKTTDGGNNWLAQLNEGINVIFNGVYFIDSLIGWTANVGRRPYKTTDGGANWIEQTNIQIFESDEVYFYNYVKGWIISGNELYYTSDGGLNWVIDPQIFTFSRNFEIISNHHFIITGTNIYESVDTGQIWQNVTSQLGSGFTSLHAPAIYLSYGVGTLGYIISYLDTSIVPVELIDFSAEYGDYEIQLNWTTAAETNNYGFEVLRSNDIDNWVRMGFVRGRGTTTEKSEYSFTDDKIYGRKFYYRLKQIDLNGNFNYSYLITIEIPINNFYLSQSYPNPFNPSTTIAYTVPEASKVSIRIYSIVGELVETLVDATVEPGYHSVEFDASRLTSGTYIYQIKAEGESNTFVDNKKMLLLK